MRSRAFCTEVRTPPTTLIKPSPVSSSSAPVMRIFFSPMATWTGRGDISEGGAREYLGTYGDAIAKRFDLVMAQAKYARQQGYPHFAVLGAVTAIELIIKLMLFRPLLQGAFLSGAWAQILTLHVAAF